MKELKIYVSDQLNDRFRKTAMVSFGYGRGSISKAAEEALLQWCERREKVDERQGSAPMIPTGVEGQSPVSPNPTGS